MQHILLGVRIDDESLENLEKIFENWLAGDQARVIVTPNAEFLLEAAKNASFANLLNRSDLAVADSVSIQYAIAALFHQRLEHRIPGVDLLERLCRIASHQHSRILLLGGDPGAAESSAQKLHQRHESLNIAALDPGRISWTGNKLEIDDGLIKKINTLSPSVVAVALGQRKQEQFIDQVRSVCRCVKIWIGVGGALEMISGKKRRSPRVLSKIGLEWLWRFVIEPWRARRIFNASIVFPLIVVQEAFRRGTLLHSTRSVLSELYRQWFSQPR